MNILKTIRPALVASAAVSITAAGLVLSSSTGALAGAKATSVLQIMDFTIDQTAGPGTFSVLGAINDGDVSATLNATNMQDSASSGGDVDITRQCVGDCGVAPGENDYTTMIAPPPVTDYATGDQELTGNAIVGAFANTRAQVDLDKKGGGSSNSQTGTTASFMVTGGGITAEFTMDYVLELVAFLDLTVDPTANGNANATSVWTLTVDEIGGGGFDQTWDPTAINMQTALVGVSATSTVSDSGSLTSPSFTLANGLYTLFINHEVNANANFSVPEPGSIAVLGLGLLGLAGIRRRKSAKLAA